MTIYNLQQQKSFRLFCIPANSDIAIKIFLFCAILTCINVIAFGF